jgi:hypothetical protein
MNAYGNEPRAGHSPLAAHVYVLNPNAVDGQFNALP